MAASTDKYIIPKLNGDNYFNWKFRVEMLLKEKDVWTAIIDEKPSPVTPIWTKADEKAFSTIVLTIDDSQLQHVRACKNAKSAWNALKDFHGKDSAGSRVRILRTIMKQRADEGANIEEHVQKVTELFQELLSFDNDIKIEFLMSATLLGSLPTSYDSLITALEARKEDELTSSFVRSKIVEEYRRRIERDGGTATAALQVFSYKSSNNQHIRKDIKCAFCKKFGHEKKNCRKFAKWLKDKECNKSTNNANMIGQFNNNMLLVIGKINGWILDSGATCHICSDAKLFSELDLNHREKVSVANGNEIMSSGRGSVNIQFVNDTGIATNVTLCDVLYVSSFGGNLISVKRLAQKGLHVNFTESKCEILLASGDQLAFGNVIDGLYKLCEKQSINFIQNKASMCIHDWHRVFGHRDMNLIKNLPNNQLVDGIKIQKCSTTCVIDCDVCVKGKMSRVPFPKESTNRATKILDLVHSDLCGPMQNQTPGGKKYVLTFIDDFSRFTTIYLLSQKSETFDAFKQYFEMTRNRFNKKLKVLRTDGGGEYMLNEFQQFLKLHGVQVQRTAPYSPQQNGVAERKNRSLVEMARCLLFDADLPNKFWGEAITTANLLQNLLPCKGIDRTPFQYWYNKKPNYTNLRRFGAKCFVRIQDANRRKFDPKAEEAIFFGFSMEAKAYKCYIMSKNKVIISRDVKFCDDIKSKVTSKIPINQCKEASYADVEIPIVPLSDVPAVSDTELIDDDVDNNEGAREIMPNQSDKQANLNGEVRERRPDRSTKANPPKRLITEIELVTQFGFLAFNGEPGTFNEAMSSVNKDEWIGAMNNEITSLHKNDTWELVKLPSNRSAIGSKWVYKIKSDKKGDVYKARLVAQGFSQKFGTDYDEVFAPVARQATLKILLSIAGHKNLPIYHLDAKTAFLNGKLNETIYMKQPPGFETEGKEDHVCLLKKSLYGLKQSARVWNQKLHQILINMGMRQSSFDACLYTYKNQNHLL